MLEADKLNNSLTQSNSALQIGFLNINPMAKMQVLLRLCLKKYFGIKKITQVENSNDFKISICSLFYFKIIDSNRCKIIKAKIPYM